MDAMDKVITLPFTQCYFSNLIKWQLGVDICNYICTTQMEVISIKVLIFFFNF